MIQVGETFDKVEPDDGKYITDADAGFDIRLRAQSVGCGQPIGQREFHLGRIVHRVVLAAQTAIQDFGSDDLSPFQPLEPGDLVEEKAIEEMVDIDPRIMVAHELPDIHQVVSILGIEIGLIGGLNDQQGKGKVATEITGIECYIRIAQGPRIAAFVDIQMKGVIFILPAEQPLDTFGILQSKDGKAIDDIGPSRVVLKEFFMGGPTQRNGRLTCGQLTGAVELIRLRFIDIVERPGG